MNFSLAGSFPPLESCEPLVVKMDLKSGFAFVSTGNSGTFKSSRTVFVLAILLGFPVPYG